jgi:hypothetical protein
LRIEIDQSGHIETTRDNTALALANGRRYAILIPPKTARACVRELRAKRVKAPKLQVRLFTAALFLLLKDQMHDQLSILIDREYAGLDRDIKTQLLYLLRKEGISVNADQIAFGHIGKKSPAHDLAIAVYRGETKADRTIEAAELLAVLQA